MQPQKSLMHRRYTQLQMQPKFILCPRTNDGNNILHRIVSMNTRSCMRLIRKITTELPALRKLLCFPDHSALIFGGVGWKGLQENEEKSLFGGLYMCGGFSNNAIHSYEITMGEKNYYGISVCVEKAVFKKLVGKRFIISLQCEEITTSHCELNSQFFLHSIKL